MYLRLVLPALIVHAVVACGGDDGGTVTNDASIPSDSSFSDASPDTCYREQLDTSNGIAPESTGLVVGGGAVAICGAVNGDHPGAGVLDVDRYEVTVTTPAVLAVRLSAPSASALERLVIEIGPPAGAVTRARVLGGVGVALVALPIGAHTISVVSVGRTPTAIPYRLAVVPDEPAARCAPMTTPIDFTEPDEASQGHRKNDVVAVWQQPLTTMLTVTTADEAEATSSAVSSGGRTTLAGLSADVASAGDDYHDRDTYAVYTGQTTNFLELRATWAAAADLDVLVFPAEDAGEPLGAPTAAVAGELVVTAVKPATLYWIWIGGSLRSAALPASYTLAVCGHELVPEAP